MFFAKLSKTTPKKVRPIGVQKGFNPCAADVASHDWLLFTTNGIFHSIIDTYDTTIGLMLYKGWILNQQVLGY